ncbi:transketolase family protein [Pectinatus frisingensis]|uniref:transketolase family protein n=1 Tax=Pectinatus frisingensis TaxID=865 RepID=UPI0018C79524|nr:transketolase C-terminal domain-containing protein [Pectinatus frisingensis]
MRNISTKVVWNLIKKDKNVVAVTADNGNEIYERIKAEYPNQYVDYGIAECNMVAGAAGMASVGKIPFLYAVTNFMSMRAYEFIRNIVCVPKFNVKFLGRSAGVVTGTYGMTHQGTEDLAVLRTLPNLLVISPATPVEAKSATEFAYRYKGPVYIRLEGYNEPELFDESYKFETGKGQIIHSGERATVISIGSVINEAIEAATFFQRKNIDIRVINMPMIKPIDSDLILQAAKETGNILTLEEHTIYGGLGSAVAEVMAEHNCHARLIRMGLNGYAKGCGNRKQMREINKISSKDIIDNIKKMLTRGK